MLAPGWNFLLNFAENGVEVSAELNMTPPSPPSIHVLPGTLECDLIWKERDYNRCNYVDEGTVE